MPRTPEQRIDEKIETLQLKLIEENALIQSLKPRSLEEFDWTRAQELRQHEATRDGIKEQIAFLSAKKAKMSSTPTHRQAPKTTKQSRVHNEILKLKKGNPSLTNEKAFELLAERSGDSEEAIRKAFYAEQKRLNDVQTTAVKEKRDSGGHSGQQDRDGK